MLNAALVADVIPGLEALKVKPVPALLTLRPGKVATPLTAFMVVVPAMAAEDGLEAKDRLTTGVLGSTLPVASTICTTGFIGVPAPVLAGCAAKTR